jgi:surface polysaccharide O-acyltransferase-like enzyme
MTTYKDAQRLAEKTPPDRNRYVDFLRAASIVVVVLGHWLMTAPQILTDAFQVDFLLSAAPWTGHLTWILQVMPIFFLVGGYANAVSWRSSQRKQVAYGTWLRARLRRLLLPVMPLLAVWTVGAYLLLEGGLDPELVRIGSQGAFVPVWFLATYVMVVALTPLTLKAWDRHGWKALIVTGVLAAVVDLVSLGGMGSAQIGVLNYVFVWGTVHGLGYAWTDSRIGSTTQRLAASAAGLAATAALVVFGPYPVAMVGLVTNGVNNSQPPKVTLLTLAVFQAGLILALEGPARRWLQRGRAWTGVVLVNGRIMTLYLWHMTAMVIVIGCLLLVDGFGLGLATATPEWWLSRPIWLAVLVVATLPFLLMFGRFERPDADHRPAPPTWQPVAAVALACIGLGLLATGGVADGAGLNGLALSLPVLAIVIGGVGGLTRLPKGVTS